MAHISHPTLSRRSLLLGGLGATATVALGVSGCGGDRSSASGGTAKISLAGPNQWNADGASFGKPWEDLIARFHQDQPDIELTTNVLPLKDFRKTLATQLSAGTAPELVFNQAPHEPHMVYPLTEDLNEANPLASGGGTWLDLFEAKYFAPGLPNVVSSTSGDFEYIPFNLVSVGLYYNTEIFEQAGIEAPIATFEELIDACGKLSAAGYTPFAMDNSDIGIGWTIKTISNMLLDKYFDELNQYEPSGEPGTAPYLTIKDKNWAKAVLTGQITAKDTPEVAESLKLLKRLFDAGATPNWTGVASSSGSVINDRDFRAGKAAMAWGVPFGYGALGEIKDKVSSMPFPTITTASSSMSTDAPARFGAGVGGTSYLIPSTTEDERLEAAITFLQWMSVAENIQPWLDATGGIPALKDATVPEGVAGMVEGTWSEPMRVGGLPIGPAGTTELSLYDGYLLGTKSMAEELDHLQDMWTKGYEELVRQNGWEDEDWA